MPRVGDCYWYGIAVQKDRQTYDYWWQRYWDTKPAEGTVQLLTETSLHRAARGEKVDVEANSKDEETPLHVAVRAAQIEAVKVLLRDFAADVNAKNGDSQTPLFLAARMGNIELVRILAGDFNADANIATASGDTPLHEGGMW